MLSKTVVKRIKAYHDYHGDSNIQVVKVIKDDEGYDAVVVRVNGNVSCLDLMDGDGDFSELDALPTEREQELIDRFVNGYMDEEE